MVEKSEISNEDLTFIEKISLLFFPVTMIFSLPVSMLLFRKTGILSYMDNGYHKKASQTFKYRFLGIVLWIGVIVLAFNL